MLTKKLLPAAVTAAALVGAGQALAEEDAIVTGDEYLGFTANVTLTNVTIGWAADGYHWTHPLDYLGNDGGGGLGSGMGTGIGAGLALQDTDRTVVAVLGDGDSMQGSSALWTAAHYSIPVLILVSNNRSNFNDEIHQETVAKMRDRAVENRWKSATI